MKKSVLRTALGVMTICLLGFASQSQAYFVAVPSTQPPLDLSKPVRVLVPGRGTDLSTQPQEVAFGRALLYKRNFPVDQVVMISVYEEYKQTGSDAANRIAVPKAGWKILVDNNQKLETGSVLKELEKFSKIRSLDFFGHNSPSLGTQSDGLGFRFDFRDARVAKLAAKFAPGAHAMIHGCNSGWIIAQALSKSWQIAVAGSFSETRFERLHSDGHFYIADEAKAPSTAWAKSNPDFGVPCSQGGCLRMRPKFSHYNGKWGNFAGPTLTHYKFFCQLETTECEKRMASSLYGFVTDHSLSPTSNEEEFSAVARDYLCPVYKDRKITDDCLDQLKEIEKGRGNPLVSYVVGDKQLKCSMKECSGKMTCEAHTCSITGRISENAMTLAQEYGHMLRGYRALRTTQP